MDNNNCCLSVCRKIKMFGSRCDDISIGKVLVLKWLNMGYKCMFNLEY